MSARRLVARVALTAVIAGATALAASSVADTGAYFTDAQSGSIVGSMSVATPSPEPSETEKHDPSETEKPSPTPTPTPS